MQQPTRNTGTILIITAGIFWGTMGLFVRELAAYGFDSIQTACLRLLIAAIIFSIILVIKEPTGFRIKLQDIPLFLGLGWGSVGLMTCCYFTAIHMMSMSTAAILLYTSPIWVMLMSMAFFREHATKQKGVALILAFLGCALVSGIGGGSTVTMKGFIIGICAGITYGLYSILGTIALKRYSPYVVTTYTFILAFIGVCFVTDMLDTLQILTSTDKVWQLSAWLLGTGIVTAVIPFIVYTVGLKYIEASRAAILATVEPLVATLLGIFIYHEAITLASGIGILCIVTAIIVLNLQSFRARVPIRK